MEDNVAFIKAELLALKYFVREELYSLSRNVDQSRTKYEQSKILEKNKHVTDKISNKDLIIKIPFKSLSQITNFFDKPNIIGSRGSTEKIVDREKFEPSQKFHLTQKDCKAEYNNNRLVNSVNYSILSPNQCENLEAYGTNSNN